MENKLTRVQAVALARSIPVVQLDYYTGEYVDEYPSIAAFADDYRLHKDMVSRALRRDDCIIARLVKHKLLIMTKENYELLKRNLSKC